MDATAKQKYEAYLASKSSQKNDSEGFFGYLVSDILSKTSQQLESNLLDQYLVQSGLQFIEKGIIEDDLATIESQKNEEEYEETLVSLFEDPQYIKAFIIGAIYGYVKLSNSLDIEPNETYLQLANLLIEEKIKPSTN
jgi:hypothetical protein